MFKKNQRRKQMTLTWPPNQKNFTELMKYALSKSDAKDVKMLVYCDNPSCMIFEPIESLITGQYQVGTAKQGNRTVKIIIAEQD